MNHDYLNTILEQLDSHAQKESLSHLDQLEADIALLKEAVLYLDKELRWLETKKGIQANLT